MVCVFHSCFPVQLRRPLPNKVHVEGKEGLQYNNLYLLQQNISNPNCAITIHYMETEGKFSVKLFLQSWLCILLPCLPAQRSPFPKGTGLDGHDTAGLCLIYIIYPGCTSRTNKCFQLQHCKYDSNMALTQTRAVNKWYREYPSLLQILSGLDMIPCINELNPPPNTSVNASNKRRKNVLQSVNHSDNLDHDCKQNPLNYRQVSLQHAKEDGCTHIQC